jgi:hypothetical protein
MKSLEISIPKPCEASWAQMSNSGKNDRFCGVCQKVVVDFTAMSDAEIKSYFKDLGNQPVCGRFSTAQLSEQNKSKVSTSKLLGFAPKGILPLGKILASVVLSLTTLLLSCNKHTKGEVLMGDTVCTIKDTSAIGVKEGESKGDTVAPQGHMLGEVAAPHK